MPIPPSTATTGAPTTGTRWPMTIATAARTAARARPGMRARASKAKPDCVSMAPDTPEDVGVAAGYSPTGTARVTHRCHGPPVAPRVGDVVFDEPNISSGAMRSLASMLAR